MGNQGSMSDCTRCKDLLKTFTKLNCKTSQKWFDNSDKIIWEKFSHQWLWIMLSILWLYEWLIIGLWGWFLDGRMRWYFLGSPFFRILLYRMKNWLVGVTIQKKIAIKEG